MDVPESSRQVTGSRAMKRRREIDTHHHHRRVLVHHSRGIQPAKRRRISIIPKAAPPTKQHQLEPSPFHAAFHSPDELRTKIKYHITRYNKHIAFRKAKNNNNNNNDNNNTDNNNNNNNNNTDNNNNNNNTNNNNNSNSDNNNSDNNSTTDNNNTSSSIASCSNTADSCGDDNSLGGAHGNATHTPQASSATQSDPPIFTLSQLAMLCESDMRNRELSLRNQYEQVLSCRLAEQYEDFLKFNNDVMNWGAGEVAASYVS